MKLTSSPRLNVLLYQMGIHTPKDVLNHLPRRYDYFVYSTLEDLHRLKDKQKVVLYGRVLLRPTFQRFRNITVTKFVFRNAENQEDYEIVAWNRSYLSGFIDLAQEYTLQGSYDAKGHSLNLLALKKGRIAPEDAIIPVYSLPSDYPEHAWRQLVAKSLKAEEGNLPDILPVSLCQRYRFISHYEALAKCHFPHSKEDIHQGLRVLKYEEALLFSIKNQLIRNANKALVRGKRETIDLYQVGDFIRALPYPLTRDQRKAVLEGLKDMNSPSLMYRLLQGDVGTGKTLVSSLLLYGNYLRHEQGALLAPTDALAKQHFETLSSLFRDTPIRVCLLVGGLSNAEKKAAYERIASGEADIIVGTHALFSKGVIYAKLGLAVIDEQHKFGVNQRTLLAEKGAAADVLLMSATPIPRTLSLTLYGDLDVSILSEFPSNKRNVITKIVKPSAKEISKSIASSIASGHRIYVVAPQIEGDAESSDSSAKEVFSRYSSLYPGLVSLLHGKMNQEEKDKAIAEFKEGNTPILISTSVIEVGIDVKQANLMIIYDPTHFALSSLHQLRGRIGRAGDEAKCLLVYGQSIQEDLDKLNVLVQTDDGFKIAEEDLRRRGPGQLAGVRQAGMPDFQFVNIIDDFKMFEYARNDAYKIVNEKNNEEYQRLVRDAEKSCEGISLA